MSEVTDMQLYNNTPFTVRSFEQLNMVGALNGIIAARGAFVVDLGGDSLLQLAGDQLVTKWEDQFEEGPRGRYLRDPGDLLPFKPATDVSILGTAYAPHGLKAKSWTVAVSVGGRRKCLRVHGERHWEPVWKGIRRRTFAGWRMTDATPSSSVQLSWEKAFGGPAPSANGEDLAPFDENPIGVGNLDEDLSPRDTLAPAPQIEAAEVPVVDWRIKYRPEGIAPIAPWWGTRNRFAGTFNDTWKQSRFPLAPADFDFRYWQSSAPQLSFEPWLLGDETIRLEGLSEHTPIITFALPKVEIFCLLHRRIGSVGTLIMFLDGVYIEVHAGQIRVRLSWRASYPAGSGAESAEVKVLASSSNNRAASARTGA